MSDFIIQQPEGSQMGDEIYTHSVYGTFNVALMKRHMFLGSLAYERLAFPLNETWVRSVMGSDTNPEVVARLSVFDIQDNPCHFIQTSPDEAIVIDGLHRIRRALELKMVWLKGYFVKLADAQAYKIRYLERKGSKIRELPHQDVLDRMWGKFPQHAKKETTT